MRTYQLSRDGYPDLIIKLDASHVEAFVIANRSAMGLSEELNTVHDSLGLLKSPGNFQAGRYDNMAAIIKSPVAVEDFGSDLRLPRDVVLVKAFRNQCAGHLPAAMNNTMAALEAKALTLVFHKGGPVFIIHPKEKGDLYRLASIRFEGARDLEEERHCVAMNQASRIAFHDMWELIVEKQGEPEDDLPAEPVSVEEEAPHTKDLLDNPTATTSSPPRPAAASSGEGEEEDDDGDPDEDAADHRSAFGTKRQKEPEHDESDVAAFMMDNIDEMQF